MKYRPRLSRRKKGQPRPLVASSADADAGVGDDVGAGEHVRWAESDTSGAVAPVVRSDGADDAAATGDRPRRVVLREPPLASPASPPSPYYVGATTTDDDEDCERRYHNDGSGDLSYSEEEHCDDGHHDGAHGVDRAVGGGGADPMAGRPSFMRGMMRDLKHSFRKKKGAGSRAPQGAPDVEQATVAETHHNRPRRRRRRDEKHRSRRRPLQRQETESSLELITTFSSGELNMTYSSSSEEADPMPPLPVASPAADDRASYWHVRTDNLCLGPGAPAWASVPVPDADGAGGANCDPPAALAVALIRHGIDLCLGDDDDDGGGARRRNTRLPVWKPEGRTAKLLAQGGAARRTLTWTGKFPLPSRPGDSECTLVRVRGTVLAPPRAVAALLLDNAATPKYNAYSAGRRDVYVYAGTGGIDAKPPHAPWTGDADGGLGHLALLENDSALFPGVRMTTTSLSHAVQFQCGPHPGYAIVSRTVHGPSQRPPDLAVKGSTEMLAGCNVVRPTKDGRWSEVTFVSHVAAGHVPSFVARGVALKGAADYIKRLKELLRDTQQTEEENGSDKAPLPPHVDPNPNHIPPQVSNVPRGIPNPLPPYHRELRATSSVSEPAISGLRVRGPEYADGGPKVHTSQCASSLLAAEFWRSDDPARHVATHPGILREGFLGTAAAPSDGDAPDGVLVINFVLPFGNLILYFQPDTSAMIPSEAKCWGDLLANGSDHAAERLKILPRVVEGPWIVRATVGDGRPAILGNAMPVSFRTEMVGTTALHEIDADLLAGSSVVARKVLGCVRSFAKKLTLDLCFVLEGRTGDELPEAVLGAVRIHRLDVAACRALPASPTHTDRGAADDAPTSRSWQRPPRPPPVGQGEWAVLFSCCLLAAANSWTWFALVPLSGRAAARWGVPQSSVDALPPLYMAAQALLGVPGALLLRHRGLWTAAAAAATLNLAGAAARYAWADDYACFYAGTLLCAVARAAVASVPAAAAAAWSGGDGRPAATAAAVACGYIGIAAGLGYQYVTAVPIGTGDGAFGPYADAYMFRQLLAAAAAAAAVLLSVPSDSPRKGPKEKDPDGKGPWGAFGQNGTDRPAVDRRADATPGGEAASLLADDGGENGRPYGAAPGDGGARLHPVVPVVVNGADAAGHEGSLATVFSGRSATCLYAAHAISGGVLYALCTLLPRLAGAAGVAFGASAVVGAASAAARWQRGRRSARQEMSPSVTAALLAMCALAALVGVPHRAAAAAAAASVLGFALSSFLVAGTAHCAAAAGPVDGIVAAAVFGATEQAAGWVLVEAANIWTGPAGIGVVMAGCLVIATSLLYCGVRRGHGLPLVLGGRQASSWQDD